MVGQQSWHTHVHGIAVHANCSFEPSICASSEAGPDRLANFPTPSSCAETGAGCIYSASLQFRSRVLTHFIITEVQAATSALPGCNEANPMFSF